MHKQTGKLNVFFEGQFWVGVFERITDGKLSVSKVTFGAEPKDYEVYEFILNKCRISTDLNSVTSIETVIKRST